MAGYLYITEYPFRGEVAPSLAQEPATGVQKVAIGDISQPLDNDTRMVALYATLPCHVAFYSGGAEPTIGTPIAENSEIIRYVHPGTQMLIATFEPDADV